MKISDPKNPEPDKETDAMAWVRHMELMKEMAGEVVVREVIYEWFEMEPAWKQVGFFISKIAGKIEKQNFTLRNWAKRSRNT